MDQPSTPVSTLDYDGLMRANLMQVFSERDAERRLSAIRTLYAADAVLNEPHGSAKGHGDINDAVTALLASLPADFVFQALAPAIGHHGVGTLHWRSGPSGARLPSPAWMSHTSRTERSTPCSCF